MSDYILIVIFMKAFLCQNSDKIKKKIKLKSKSFNKTINIYQCKD